MKSRQYSFLEFDKLLKNNGWVIGRNTASSHVIYTKYGNHISIPRHKTINRMLTKRLIKENNIEV